MGYEESIQVVVVPDGTGWFTGSTSLNVHGGSSLLS